MPKTLHELQAELPRTISLYRYNPVRKDVGLAQFNPAGVNSVNDLPEYLILGGLDHSKCKFSDKGWYAKWQGLESNTSFEIEYLAEQKNYEIRQTWCGIDGGLAMYPAKTPLGMLIAQSLYTTFPRGWDQKAKKTLEDIYQLKYQEQPENFYTFCGLPDGAFCTIAFPVNAQNLRNIRQTFKDWEDIRSVVNKNLPYPFSVEAKLVSQAVNYIEGKAPEWTKNPIRLFLNSLTETGLVAQDFPVREQASDGSAAWTLKRELYYLFISLPFAGLSNFLERLASPNGQVRRQIDGHLRGELLPIILPAGFEVLVKRIATTDQGDAIRTFLFFTHKTPTVDEIKGSELTTEDDINTAEQISKSVSSAYENLVKKHFGPNATLNSK